MEGRPEEVRIDAHAIDFVSTQTGWLVGQYGRLMKTEDGGVTWTPAQTPLGPKERPFLFDLCFVDEQNGWVVGEGGTILHTSDGGVTWLRQNPGVDGAQSVPKPEIIQRRAGVFDTVDTGERTPGFFLTSVRFLDAKRGWVIGHYGYEARSLVLHTADGGDTWAVEAEVKGEELRALYVLDADHAWAVGDRVREGPQVILRFRGVAAKRS